MALILGGAVLILHACTIHEGNVEIVETYKYLGTMFGSRLKFDKNTVFC